MSSIFRTLSVFTSGSVWAFYLLTVIIRIHFVWINLIRRQLNPRPVRNNSNGSGKGWPYNVFSICWDRKHFKRFLIQIYFVTLAYINSMWEFHDKFPFSISPKKFKSLTRSIIVPNIVSRGDNLMELLETCKNNNNMYLLFHNQWKFVYSQPVIDFGKFWIDYWHR